VFSKSYIRGFTIHPVAIRKQLGDILALIAELTQNNINEDVRHTLVIDRMELPGHETHRHIHELESLGMIKIQSRRSGLVDDKGREYRLINITREGLQELSLDQTGK
jgi:hypothetical protein